MYDELKTVIAELGAKVDGYKATLAEEVKFREVLEQKLNLARLGPDARPSEPPAAMWRDAKTGERVPVMGRDHKFADLVEAKGDVPSLGRLLRGLILGSKADDARELSEERKSLSIDVDSSGGVLVPEQLSARFIDGLRAASVLNRAGVTVVPMGSKELTLARLTSDAGVYWRGENAPVDTGDPQFGALTLHAKTVATLVKISLELSQDSANLEAILQSTLTNAMASEIDSAGLNGVAVDSAAAPTGLFNTSGIGKVLTVGAPTNYDHLLDALYTLEAANVPTERVGGIVGHPAYWRKLRGLKTGLASDQSTLVAPPDIARLPRLSTTAAPFTGGNTAKCILGNWADLIMGIRKDVSVRVLRTELLADRLQVGVLCYSRLDFGCARPASFVSCEGVTV